MFKLSCQIIEKNSAKFKIRTYKVNIFYKDNLFKKL